MMRRRDASGGRAFESCQRPQLLAEWNDFHERHLARSLERGEVNCFTGAGFSTGARDVEGRTIPTSDELAEEIWHLCFGDEERDQSSLQDLFQHARVHRREELRELIVRRLSIDPTTLPRHYEVWLSLPWRRLYTLNVDDLASAATRRFELRRPIAAVSALAQRDPTRSPGRPPEVLECVHLNGIVDDAPDGVTFSTTQYGERLARKEHWYVELSRDLLQAPFVFVGTKLAEPLVWQYVEPLRERGIEARPLSFFVTPRLDRARQSLLADLRIEWIAMTARQFAERVLSPVGERLALRAASRFRAEDRR